MTQCQSVSTFESEMQNSLSALETRSMDSLGTMQKNEFPKSHFTLKWCAKVKQCYPCSWVDMILTKNKNILVACRITLLKFVLCRNLTVILLLIYILILQHSNNQNLLFLIVKTFEGPFSDQKHSERIWLEFQFNWSVLILSFQQTLESLFGMGPTE